MRIGRRTRCRSIAYIAPELSTVLKILRPLASLSQFLPLVFLFLFFSFFLQSLFGFVGFALYLEPDMQPTSNG